MLSFVNRTAKVLKNEDCVVIAFCLFVGYTSAVEKVTLFCWTAEHKFCSADMGA